MFCKKCGKEISDDSFFCEYCGQEVKKPVEGNSASSVSGSPAPGVPAPGVPVSGTSGQADGNKTYSFETTTSDAVKKAFGDEGAKAEIEKDNFSTQTSNIQTPNYEKSDYSTGSTDEPKPSFNGGATFEGKKVYAPIATPNHRTSSKKKWLIPAIIIVVIAALGVLIGVTSSGSSFSLQDENGYKDSCAIISYNDFKANTDEYAGEKVEFTGQVFDLKTEGGDKVFVLDTTYDEDYDMYYGGTVIVKCDKDIDVKTWDKITIYGEATGKKETYKASEYGSYNVPVVEVKYVDFQ